MKTMSMTVEQIVEETRSLPPDVVAEVVDRILLAMQGGQETAQAQAWSKTVHRRIEEIRSGKVEGVPAEVSAARIRKIVGR